MNRNIIIDPLNKSSSHLFFNSSVVLSLTKTDGALFIGERSHAEKVKEMAPGCEYLTFTSKTIIGRILTSVKLLLSKCIFKKHKVLFVCLDNTFVPLLLLMFYPLLFTNSFSFIIHNNLSTLSTNVFKRSLHRLMINIYDAKVYVLSKEMKFLYDLDIAKIDKSIFVPHPNYKKLINFDIIENLLLFKTKVNVIILGRQAQLMISFFNNFNFDQFTNIHFTIGYSDLPVDFKQQNVTVINRRLSFDEYYTLLSLTDFSLFALDHTVKNRASGILMDCISLSCPVIAPRAGHYGEYEDFNVGYFYKDYDDLKLVFQNINDSIKRRSQLKGQFEDALKYSSLDNLDMIVIN